MDNNELDKILRQKLNDKIKPSKELEYKIKQKIEEEKYKKLKTMNIETKGTKNKYIKLKTLVSIAAVLLVALVLGINYYNIDEKKITVATIKSIEPTKMLNGIIQNDSEFLIYADNANIETVKKCLYIEPALDYSIEKEDKDVYKLKFKQNIPDNTIVKLQYVKNKITEDSWAYQTSSKLSVSRIYPENNMTDVSQNTVIDIEFSYASVENIEENVTINPEIKGEWKKLGKIWRFIPESALLNQTYTVKIHKGIKAQDEILEEDYIFSFDVGDSYQSTKYKHIVTTIDEIENCKPDEFAKIHYRINSYDDSSVEISKIEINKFKDVEDFISYIKTKEYKNIDKLGEYKFTKNEYYLQLNSSLQTGYYIAIIKDQNNKEIFNCPIQVNELSAYAIQTERDIITWVAKGNELADNVSVQYLDKEIKTDKEGIAEFNDILDGTKNIKYLKIGNGQDKLIVGVYNYEHNNYPMGYIYTDRPLYKNTDTINIWGFVPRQLFYDEINEDGFYIKFGNEQKHKVKIDKNGSFNYKIELKNHIDEEYINVVLYYEDNYIAGRNVSITNYELQNYTYKVIIDKNYGYEGESFEFKVKVEHITGLVVPNKPIEIKYHVTDTTYREITDENGIAKFSIKLPKLEQQYSAPRYSEVGIYNGEATEYTTSSQYIPIYILHSDTYAQIKTNNNEKYELTLYKLAKDKKTNVSYDLQEIYDGNYDTNVDINLIESVYEKYIDSYQFNEYTKENEPIYMSRKISENVKKIDTILTQNGKLQFDTTKIKFKEKTENIFYSYELEFVYKDTNGKQIKETQYLYSYDEFDDNSLGYTYISEYMGYGLGNIPVQIDEGSYYTYRYLLKNDVNKFSIGEKVKFVLAESTESGIKNINNNGKILRLVFKENITKKEIIENNNLDYTFTKEDFPGCVITSAYFINGKFYRMPIYYFDYEEQNRKVDVEIIADKEEYKPGDTVNLTIKTTNNGNGIKSIVNVSVVNKAVFEITGDMTELASNIYENKRYKIYTYSTYKDFFESDSGGGGGGNGEVRGEFGDTACFETIETNSKGIATISFTLPDNVTTYTVTAHSVNKDLYLGVNKKDIVSKLDFFIQSTEPRNVKVTDDLVLNASSIAEEKYNVKYEFTIKELNKTLTAEANTNSIATVNFGKLPFGTYNAVIKAQYGEYKDAIEYKFNIIESAQEVKDKQTIQLHEETQIEPNKNPIVLEIYNKDMENYVKYIEFIEKTLNERLDTKIAYNQIQKLKEKYYDVQAVTNQIKIAEYTDGYKFKNLKNGQGDTVLAALISKYAPDCYASNGNSYIDLREITQDTNLFEIYLLAAANNEPVLTDLRYLKEEKDITNYNKLLVTLSLEFLGDYQSAKELYNSIQLKYNEKNEYKSIIALIETFINKTEAVEKINELIKEKPEDEYLRFAILSFFENNSMEIEKEDTVKIINENTTETIKINGMQVKTVIINNEQLKTIKFETENNDLMVSYYYQTLLDNIQSDNISKDIKIKLDGNFKKGETVRLSIDFDNEMEGEVRIVLPNSLRLVTEQYDYNNYYLMSNQIDYVTFYKSKNCKRMNIPLIISNEGEYKFENIVCNYNGTYHISNSIDFTTNK